MKVLIADDDGVTRLLLAGTVRRAKHEAVVVSDGEEAWDALRQGGIRLVVTDWEMPRLDGPGLCERIRRDAQNEYIYVILLTSHARPEDLVRALEAGADDFIAKPFNTAELCARLEVGRRIIELQSHLAGKVDELEATNQRLADTNEALESQHRALLSTQRKLVDAEKLGIAGRLAGGVAHEINTPLSIVKSNLGALHEDARRIIAQWQAARAVEAELRAGQRPELSSLAERLAGPDGGRRMDALVEDIPSLLADLDDGAARIEELMTDFGRLGTLHQPGEREAVDVTDVVDSLFANADAPPATGELQSLPAQVSRDDLQRSLKGLIDWLRPKSRHPWTYTRPLVIRTEWQDVRPSLCIADPALELSDGERENLFEPHIGRDWDEGRMRLELSLFFAFHLLHRNGADVSVEREAGGGTAFRIVLEAA